MFAVPTVIALVVYATYVFNVGRFNSVFSFTVLSVRIAPRMRAYE